MLKRGRDAARHPGRRGEGGAAGSIVKGGLCLEALGTVDAVVLDKTGTVTFGEPRIAAVHPEEGADEKEVLATAAVGEKRSEHPVARAILAKAAEAGLPVRPPESFLSFPGRATLVGSAYCTVTASPSESIPCRVTCDHAPASPPCVRSRVL